MERVNQIWQHPVWRQKLEQLKKLEKERIFCCHGIEHLLDVARIAYIENLEQQYGIEKALIYAAALLHDIGKGEEYTKGIPHEIAGKELAEEILKDTAFSEEEQREILEAILAHREESSESDNLLKDLLYRADKKSRMCALCKATEECNWSKKKKNNLLMV